jgi:hypothetical protein
MTTSATRWIGKIDLFFCEGISITRSVSTINLKGFMRYFLLMIAATATLFLGVVNFSAVRSQYSCAGTFIGGGLVVGTELFFRLDAYRPWVGLWNESDGDMIVEYLGQEHFEHLRKDGVFYEMFEKAGGPSHGRFSTLSGYFELSDPNKKGKAFSGQCKPL